MNKGAKDFKKIHERIEMMFERFNFFIRGEWRYLNNHIYSVIDRLSDQEKEEFNCDVLEIHWPQYLQHYLRGIQIWVMGHDIIVPEAKLDQIVLQNYQGREDLLLSLQNQPGFVNKSSQNYELRILQRKRFEAFALVDSQST